MVALAESVTAVLDQAIHSILSLGGDDNVRLVLNLESIRNDMSSSLSLTQNQEELLRRDIIKLECEESTENDELTRLQTKLSSMRQERDERRIELQNESTALSTQVDEKRHNILEMQSLKEQAVLKEMESQRARFNVDMDALNEKKNELTMQYSDTRNSFAEKERCLEASISTLKLDMQKTVHSFEATAKEKRVEVDAITREIARQAMHICELENTIKLISLNNIAKREEEKKLNELKEVEKKAMSLLGRGATALQKVWRGRKARNIVTELKTKKSKKGKKKK
jgi:chromosome segregation ATPase